MEFENSEQKDEVEFMFCFRISTSPSHCFPFVVPTVFPWILVVLALYIGLAVKVRTEAPPSELAVAVARHFESMEVDEEEVIGGFLERLEQGPSVATEYSRQTQRYPVGGMVVSRGSPSPMPAVPSMDAKQAAAVAAAVAAATAATNKKKGGKQPILVGKDGKPLLPADIQYAQQAAAVMMAGATADPVPSSSSTARSINRKRTKWAARPGEQVAAKVTRTDENGSWILASVQRFYIDTETYDVQDEDDTSKLIRLPWSHVMRLSTGAEGCFVKGADCMAIFPETTSFYKSRVAKSPVWKLDHGVPCVKDIVVCFDDDEDVVTGKTPKRRVPSRYVIPTPQAYFYDEHEDVDLVAPSLSNREISTNKVGSSSSTGTGTTAGANGGTIVVNGNTTILHPSIAFSTTGGAVGSAVTAPTPAVASITTIAPTTGVVPLATTATTAAIPNKDSPTKKVTNNAHNKSKTNNKPKTSNSIKPTQVATTVKNNSTNNAANTGKSSGIALSSVSAVKK